MNSADLAGDVLTHFVDRARRLYTLPAVALRVLELSGRPTVDIHELAACIEQDPALASKILRTVNSSLFGLSERVSNLKQSIALLGSQPLKMLVLGFSLPGNLASNTGALVLKKYWQHALLTALSAREIAGQCFQQSGDDEFAAGLLQDLGLLVLVQDLGETYERFLVGVWEQGDNLLTEESKVLGFDHQFLTAKLLQHWHFPEPFIHSIERWQSAESLGASQSAHILYLANLLTTFLIDRRPEVLRKLLHTGERSCGLTMAKLESMVAKLEQKLPQLAEVLSLELPGEAIYSDVLLQAYKRLSETTDQVASHWLVPPQRPNDLLRDQLAREVEILNDSSVAASTTNTTGAGGANNAGVDCPRATRSGLVGKISAEVARCRQARSPLSLVLIELDDSPRLRLASELCPMGEVTQQLAAAIQKIVDGDGNLTQVTDRRFALFLRNCDRRRAVDVAWRITDSVRNWWYGDDHSTRATRSVSVGVATLAMPPRNFPAEELLTAAERCLHGVQLSGGDSVKSIDIY